MKFNQVFIDVLPTSTQARLGAVPVTSTGVLPKVSESAKRGYWATLVQDDQGRHFFLAKGITQALSADEYVRVLHHPYLHYFSAALKVHTRMERLLDNFE